MELFTSDVTLGELFFEYFDALGIGVSIRLISNLEPYHCRDCSYKVYNNSRAYKRLAPLVS